MRIQTSMKDIRIATAQFEARDRDKLYSKLVESHPAGQAPVTLPGWTLERPADRP